MTIKEKIMANGNRWTKNNMDRTYLNYSDISQIEVDGLTAYAWFNRRERQSIKIYWDHINEEIVITVGDKEQKDFIIKAIQAM